MTNLRENKLIEVLTSSILILKHTMSIVTSISWVLDTMCGSHLCNSMRELKNDGKLAKGEVSLRVGNGAKVVALAVRTYYLSLP